MSVLPALAPSSATAAPPELRARVHGGGPTGALAALALADAGWCVSLHDPLEEPALRARSRAYALTHSSRRLLERLGLWQALEPLLTPFHQLHLRDLGAAAGLAYTPLDLPRSGSGSSPGALGWIAQHGDLMGVLLSHLRATPAVTVALGESPPSPGLQDRADLVLAADGPASPTRQALGIRHWRLSYRQACLTAQVELRGPGADAAWELLRPEGPFAVLPLGGGRSQVVWSAPARRCAERQALVDTAFLELLAGVLPPALEVDALLDDPRSFPVALELAQRLHRGRTLLVGESAHRCHPVGGQGLNLCWRDVAALHRLALRVRAGRLPLDQLGRLYARGRLPDLLLTLAATDLMVRLFSNRSPLLLPLRRLALALLERSRALRRFSLKVMSDGALAPVSAPPH